MWYLLLIPLLVCLLLWLLYLAGCPVRITSARLFYRERLANGSRFRVMRCGGTIFWRLCPRESGAFCYSLEDELSRGTVQLTVSDTEQNLLFTLNAQNPTAVLQVERGQSYRFALKFFHSSGNVSLTKTKA